MPGPAQARARAKVNLWLSIVGRRADGYHLLDTLVAFADLADTLQARPSDGLSLTLDGPAAAGLAREPDNLVLRAARLLAERAGVAPRAALALTKRIPVAAGLGGGSADAAAALRLLSDLWRVTLSSDELHELAGKLGADVPMCLAGCPALASGIGERLAPVPALPPCGLLLVNPGVPLATAQVFAARRGSFSPIRPPRPWSTLADLIDALAERGNDLAPAARTLLPTIGEVEAALWRSGARYVAMSGSGPTCFALFEAADEARRAAEGLPAAWWRHAGMFA